MRRWAFFAAAWLAAPAVHAVTAPVFPSTAAAASQNVEVSTVTGDTIEFDEATGQAIVDGHAVIESSTATITADKLSVDTQRKQGRAEGNVTVKHASGTITGREADYNWETSTGTLRGATGESPPWRFWSEEMEQEAENVFEMHDGGLTSCDHNPPHYMFRARKGRVKVGVRAKMKSAKLVVDETPSFWFPYYTRSLRPKKYSLRIEPGSSGRDGFTNRTTIGYPFSKNTYTKVRWDYLERTGNGFGLEHRYFNPNIKGDFDAYQISDRNPDLQPESDRYSVLWNHYQRFTPRLTANAKIDVKSDQVFGNQFQNVGNDVRVENQSRGVFSEGGLNYQFPRAALQVQADRRDRFDSAVSSSNFISKLTLPRVTYNTIPLTYKYFPFYTSFSGTYANETLVRTAPSQTLRYQRSAGGTVQIKKDLRLKKTFTFTPVASYNQTWQDRDLAFPDATKDIYVGRYTTGFDMRKRIGRSLDTTADYRYGERFERNRTTVDRAGDDRGVETHRVNLSAVSRIGRNTRASLSSGWDLRDDPRSDPSKYKHEAARVTPPTLDVQWQATQRVSVYFRETYSLYDAAARRNVLTPLNTSGEVAVGNIAGRTFFSQGFSYTKKSVADATSDLLLTNKLRFYASPKWHLDLFVSYRATGDEKLDYRKVLPIEKTIRVARDLHCWVFRMEFSERPGRKEASFYIDLKANLSSQRNLFAPTDYYPEAELDVADIFPENTQQTAPDPHSTPAYPQSPSTPPAN